MYGLSLRFETYIVSLSYSGKASGIYATNSPEACAYVILNSNSSVVVVENHAQLQKILQVWDDLPLLKAIVQYTGEVAERRENIYSVRLLYWHGFIVYLKSVDFGSGILFNWQFSVHLMISRKKNS